jgi:hypothetical protein
MKLIDTTTGPIVRLEREVERLKKDNARQAKKIASLSRPKGLPGGSNPPRPVLPAAAEKPLGTSANAATPSTPSYMKPTEASEMRRGKTKCDKGKHQQEGRRNVTIRGEKWYYKYPGNGKLYKLQESRRMRMVDSAVAPESPKSPAPPPPSEPTSPVASPASPALDQSWPEPPDSEISRCLACCNEGKKQNWIRDETLGHLAFCFDEVTALEYAQTAFRLGKEALWEYTREHHPQFHRKLSRISPLFILASHTEFERSTGWWSLAPDLHPALRELADLRNFVSHPRMQGELYRYDGAACKAFYLLRWVGDEPRIQQLRDARDALRTEAERTFAEIRDRGTLFYDLPGDYVEDVSWDRRHTDVFRRCILKTPCSWFVLESIHPEISRVAEAWGNVNYEGQG